MRMNQRPNLVMRMGRVRLSAGPYVRFCGAVDRLRQVGCTTAYRERLPR